MDEKKQQIKRFLHDNAVTVATVLIFVVILGILLLSRVGSLLSIANIANINPLITTESAKLVAVNVNGVIKIIKDDDGKVTEAEKKAAVNDKTSTTGKTSGGASGSGSNGSSGGSSGSNGGSGSSSGGGTSGGGGSPSSSSPPPPPSSSSPPPPPQQSPFTASLTTPVRIGNAEVRDKKSVFLSLGLVVTCKNDHTMRTRVTMNAGTGSAQLRWKLNGVVVDERTQSLNASASYNENYQAVITTTSSGSNTITVEVVRIVGQNEAVVATNSTNVNHSC